MQKSIHSAAYAHFLAELRALRSETGVTQVQLAQMLNEEQTFVSKVERGVRRLDVVELREWVAALGTPLAAFAERLESRLGRNHGIALARTRKK